MLHYHVYIWARNRRIQRFLARTEQTESIQRSILFSKLAANSDSVFGREHGFPQIRTIAQYRKQVPITSYEYYREYVESVKRGDLTAMFGRGTRVLMFAMTSGTTGQAKYVPVTKQFLKEYRDGWSMWGVRTFRDHPDLLRKKTIQLTSDWQQYRTVGGFPCGNISGLAIETKPRISDGLFILPRSLMKVSHSLSKRYTALRISMAARRIGMIVTANPSTLVEFAKLADDHGEMLIRDIHDGTLSDEVIVSNDIRRSLRRFLRPHPKRARELERIIARTDRLLPKDFWPDLSVLAVWTGGSVGMYIPRLRDYYGETAICDHGLSASEGRMTLPLQDGSPAGVLDYAHSYFEFIPEDERGNKNPTVLEAHELEEGSSYFILLTTSSGFYRYDIHDVVRCVGFEGRAPLLEFLNKGSLISSITGEKLSEYQVVSAVKTALSELGMPRETFTVAPVFGDPPGYVLFVESGTVDHLISDLANRVDKELAKINCEYADRLDTGRLRAMQPQAVPRGTWKAYRKTKISQPGGSLEQYKHPWLANDLNFGKRLKRLEPLARRLDLGIDEIGQFGPARQAGESA